MLDLYFQQFIDAAEGNTVDSLTTVRVVKYDGVEVYFKKKNLGLRLQGLPPHRRREHAGARRSPPHLGECDLGTPQVIRCWQS